MLFRRSAEACFCGTALLLCVWFAPGRAHAQAGNATYTLTGEAITSAGGIVSSQPAAWRAETCLGLPASGLAENTVYKLTDGLGEGQPAAQAPITATLAVTGTVDDPSASVTVNGAAAAVAGNAFTADVTLLLGPNVIVATATDAAGNSRTQTALIYLDLPESEKTARFSIAVSGTVNEAGADVFVNDVLASVANGVFSADVMLTTGLNTLTARASDAAGNTMQQSIRVFVPLPAQPPAMPTVGTTGQPLPAITTQSSITISGTKTAGTSIWINGVEVVGADDELTWSVVYALTEGDNELVIVAKDASGASSVPVKRTVVVDNQPPVIQFAPGQPPAKTNINPFLLRGEVDDSLTTVWVNGIAAARNKRSFELAVGLAAGSNPVQITARSPNGFDAAPQNYMITLGTIPAIQNITPPDGTIFYLDATAVFSAAASDAEGDAIQYRLLVDGGVAADWQTANSLPWTPGASQLGLQPVSVEVKDDFGGSNNTDLESFVIHAPLQHP